MRQKRYFGGIMNESAPGLYSLPHAVFLRRLAGATRGTSLDARLGRGAFVALRLIDLLAPDEPALPRDAFRYQHAATDRACRGLPADLPETSHLIGVVQSTADAYHTHDVGLLFPALFAYAHYLEDEMCLEEALDVLETLERVGGDKYRAEDRVAARLRVARVLRKLTRFDEAERMYAEAEALAAGIGDTHSRLLSRIGHAEAVRGRGNLGDAESSLHLILREVAALGDQGAQARAHHVLAAVLHNGGRPAEAIPHVWRAFELYDDELSRSRALGDLGGMLLMVGDPQGAERAFNEVLRRAATEDVLTNAMIDLMNCASFQGNRLGFERWREQCESRRDSMSPNILVDFVLKEGIGRGRFGQFDRAEPLLVKALQIAESSGLHEFAFRIQRITSGLHDCRQEPATTSGSFDATEAGDDAVREVSASLARLEC